MADLLQTVFSVKLWKQTKNCIKIFEGPIKKSFLGTDGNQKHKNYLGLMLQHSSAAQKSWSWENVLVVLKKCVYDCGNIRSLKKIVDLWDWLPAYVAEFSSKIYVAKFR